LRKEASVLFAVFALAAPDANASAAIDNAIVNLCEVARENYSPCSSLDCGARIDIVDIISCLQSPVPAPVDGWRSQCRQLLSSLWDSEKRVSDLTAGMIQDSGKFLLHSFVVDKVMALRGKEPNSRYDDQYKYSGRTEWCDGDSADFLDPITGTASPKIELLIGFGQENDEFLAFAEDNRYKIQAALKRAIAEDEERWKQYEREEDPSGPKSPQELAIEEDNKTTERWNRAWHRVRLECGLGYVEFSDRLVAVGLGSMRLLPVKSSYSSEDLDALAQAVEDNKGVVRELESLTCERLGVSKPDA